MLLCLCFLFSLPFFVTLFYSQSNERKWNKKIVCVQRVCLCHLPKSTPITICVCFIYFHRKLSFSPHHSPHHVRSKAGVTQADVGKALANLKLPGVGALSQSTICRFESLTLSHNNMIALKPILQAWLEEAEAQAKNKRRDPDAPSVLPAGEKKR